MEHIVETTIGKVRGYERDNMVEYLGIPYAKPPVEGEKLPVMIYIFGGDLSRVTIFGESAGGASVINMLACPRGLF